MLQFSSDLQSVHSECGKKSIYVFQELSVTSPLNPGCSTKMGVFRKMQVISNNQKHLISLYLKAGRRTSSDHERENWITHIVYSHIFPSQTKLTRSAFHKFIILRWSTPQHWDPCLHTLKGGGEQNQIPEPLLYRGTKQSGMVGSAGTHHLKTSSVWVFIRILGKTRESCNWDFCRFRHALCVSPQNKILVYTLGATYFCSPTSHVPQLLRSLYRQLANFHIGFRHWV